MPFCRCQLSSSPQKKAPVIEEYRCTLRLLPSYALWPLRAKGGHVVKNPTPLLTIAIVIAVLLLLAALNLHPSPLFLAFLLACWMVYILLRR